MSAPPERRGGRQQGRRRQGRRGRRLELRRPLAWVAAGLFVLAVGIALGMALQDNPSPNLTVTTTKTVVP